MHEPYAFLCRRRHFLAVHNRIFTVIEFSVHKGIGVILHVRISLYDVLRLFFFPRKLRHIGNPAG